MSNSTPGTSDRSSEEWTLDQAAQYIPELARAYLEQVAPVFSQSSKRSEQTWVWHVFVPSQAYVSETVRYGLLTTAAIYLYFSASSRDEQEVDVYLSLSKFFGGIFVARSRAEIQTLASTNPDADLASTRFLCILALVFFRQRRGEGTAEGTEWTWVYLLRGFKTVHESLIRSGRVLQPRILQDMVPENPEKLEFAPHQSDWPTVGYIDETSPILLYFRNTQQPRFATLRFGNLQRWFGVDEAVAAQFSAAIDGLCDITERVCANRYDSIFRTVVSWIGDLPESIVQMLVDHHPGALAVYTHWLMLLLLIEDLWWIGDMGRAGIQSALQDLEEE